MTGAKRLDRVWNTYSPCICSSATAYPHSSPTLDPVRKLNLLLSTSHYLATTDEGDLAPTTSTTFTSWQDVTRMNCWSWHRTGMSGENLWSSDLTYRHPTRQRNGARIVCGAVWSDVPSVCLSCDSWRTDCHRARASRPTASRGTKKIRWKNAWHKPVRLNVIVCLAYVVGRVVKCVFI